MLSLEADGSAMYTIQSLWTQARESLDVTTVILNNRSYAILNIELARTGAGAGGPKARDLLDLSRPDLDFVQLAGGIGVPAVAVRTADEAVAALERAIAEPGPHLIEAMLEPRRVPGSRPRSSGRQSRPVPRRCSRYDGPATPTGLTGFDVSDAGRFCDPSCSDS